MTVQERTQDYSTLVIKNAPICDNYKFFEYLLDNGFFDAPASTKYHGVYPGGLYDHSFAVFNRLNWLTQKLDLKWQRKESPFIVGMYHDLCKIDQYKKVKGIRSPDPKYDVVQWDAGYHYEYNTDMLLKGHGAKSVLLLSQFMVLTEEEMLCIRYHMGPYEKEEWNEYDLAIRKYQTVLLTHTADMFASKVDKT